MVCMFVCCVCECVCVCVCECVYVCGCVQMCVYAFMCLLMHVNPSVCEQHITSGANKLKNNTQLPCLTK
jgi:hypothetical protein